jgi:hypothetical protein
MAVRYNIDRWPTAQPAALLANKYGKHILNIEASEDAWNGCLVGRGDYVAFEYFEEAEAGEFEAKIVDQMANGDYVVLVEKADDVYFVYNAPVVETEWTNDFRQEKNFFIKKGELMRSHELAKNDRFGLSADGFDGEPYVGAVISGVSGRKPVVEASA